MRRGLLWFAVAAFVFAALVSVVGGPWDTFAHHTALTGFAEAAFVLSFLIKEKRQ